MADLIQNQEFIQEFVDEAKNHVEKVEAALVNKETLTDEDTIHTIFRAVHSIKGTAGFFGLKNIVSIAHAMENIFGQVREERFALNDNHIDVLLTANDCLKDMITDVFSSEEQVLTEFLTSLDSITDHEQDTITLSGENQTDFNLKGLNSKKVKAGLAHGQNLYEVRFKMNQDLLDYQEGPMKLFLRIESVGTLVDTLTDHSRITSLDDVLTVLEGETKDIYLWMLVITVLERELFAQVIDIPVENVRTIKVKKQEKEQIIKEKTEKEETQKKEIKKEVTPKESIVEDNIRVHVSILNDLINMASEMVLGRNQLLQTLENYRKTIPGITPILQNIDRLTSGMQEKIMQTRMQPLGNVFNKFPRIIRDISKSLSKDIVLTIEGEEVELDKSMIEGLTDPLTHLIRNAADHGIESEENRQKAGKTSKGTIMLKAYHESGYVHIDVIDDGKGIEIENIKKKALEKELLNKSQLDKLSEQEMLKLIFKPGFSTAERITDVSGRGVGMDVVKTNIEKLGGYIEIFTKVGEGTTIRLMLPLTLAILQSLIVEVEGERFALAQVNIKEIVKIKKGDDTRKIEFVNDSQVLRLRGKLLPIVHLADVLGMNKATTISERAEMQESLRVFVLKIGSRRFGVLVDTVIGSEEILVKPLPVYLKDAVCYSGVTIMGDGKIAMILDAEGIIKESKLKFIEEKSTLTVQQEIDASQMNETQNILLFKCSGNETFAIDLSMIARIEEIKREDIECVGDKMYIKHLGSSLRVIRPEEYLSVNKNVAFSEKLYVIIPKLVRHPIGIIAEKVYDNINVALKLKTEDIQMECLVGSAVYDNKILLVINLYELFEKADPQNYKIAQRKALAKKSLLLVEDTPFFQRMVKGYLESIGYDVILAPNGKAAFELLQNKHFDAVISDIQMPIMDGFELVKKIKDSKTLTHLPVIALTSMTGAYNKKLGIEKGFDYYEFKLDRDRLLDTIEKALTKEKGGG